MRTRSLKQMRAAFTNSVGRALAFAGAGAGAGVGTGAGLPSRSRSAKLPRLAQMASAKLDTT